MNPLPKGFVFKDMGPETPQRAACPFCDKELALKGLMAHATRYCDSKPEWYRAGLTPSGFYIARLGGAPAKAPETTELNNTARVESAAEVASDSSESEDSHSNPESATGEVGDGDETAAPAPDGEAGDGDGDEAGDGVGDGNETLPVDRFSGKEPGRGAAANANPGTRGKTLVRRSSRASRPAIAADGREKRANDDFEEEEERGVPGGGRGRGRGRGGRGGRGGGLWVIMTPSSGGAGGRGGVPIGGRGRGGRGRGAGAAPVAPPPVPKPTIHVALVDGQFACGVPGCVGGPFKTEPGLKRHVTSMHGTAAKANFVCVPENELPGDVEDRTDVSVRRRARRAGSAAVGEFGDFGEYGNDEFGDGDVLEHESDGDGDFEMRAAGGGDDDATRDSSSEDEEDPSRETTGARRRGPGRPPRNAALGVSRFMPKPREGDERAVEDDGADLDSELLNAEATAAARSGRKRKGARELEGENSDENSDDAPRENAPSKPKPIVSCEVCGHVFAGPQGIPGHFKKHITKGTPEESIAGQAAFDRYNEDLALRRAGTGPPRKKNKFQKKPPPAAPRRDNRNDDDEVDELIDPALPLLLDATARHCTECRKRCKTQAELIQHMWHGHQIEAKDKVEYEGVVTDAAGLRALEGEPPVLGNGAGYDIGGVSNSQALVVGGGNGNGGSQIPNHHAHADANADADGERVVDVELVRDLLIRQQTSERLLDDARTSILRLQDTNNLLTHHINELRGQTCELFAAQRHPFDPHAEIRRVKVTSNDELGYSPITLFGRMVWLTGIVASDRRCDTTLQTQQTLLLLKQVLVKAGTDLYHLLKVTVYLSDIREADKMYAAWDLFFDSYEIPIDRRPVRITQAAVLKAYDYLVELHAEAVMPSPIHQAGMGMGMGIVTPGSGMGLVIPGGMR